MVDIFVFLEPKRPLFPPTATTATRPHAVSCGGSVRGKTKPLPSPPRRSRSPGNPVTNTDTEESEIEIRQHEEEALQEGSNSGQTVSNLDTPPANVHNLLSENDALKRKIYHLEQQQHSLRQENQLLRQNLVATHSSSGGNTPTCTLCGNDETDSPSPSPSSPVQVPASTDERLAPDPARPDPKLIAKAQLTRVIEKAKASSPDTVDPTGLSQPISKPVISTQPPSDSQAEHSRNPSITSPLSPPISTPSPSLLVSIGLASQAKRGKDIHQDLHSAEDSGQVSKEVLDKQIVNKPIPLPRKARQLQESESPYENNSTNEDTFARADGSDAAEPHEEDEVVRQAKPGQFTSKLSSNSIVAATTKLFQGNSAGDQAATQKSGTPKQQVRKPKYSPLTIRAKESVSSPCDDVFSPGERHEGVVAALAMQHQRNQHRTAMSESQVELGGESEEKMGVVSKKSTFKSDVSWIKPKHPSQSEETDGDGNGGPESPADVLSPSPTVRPYRSHQILNTSSPPPPQGAKPTTPRTFHATSQLTSPSSSKSANHHQSHGLTNELHSRSPHFERRGRGVSISDRNRVKSKRQGNLRENEMGLSRSASDESLHETVKRGIKVYSSQREQVSFSPCMICTCTPVCTPFCTPFTCVVEYLIYIL